MPAPLLLRIKALDKTAKAFASAKRGIAAIGGSLLSLKTALVAVVGGAGFGMLIKQGLAAGDSLAKTADKIGVTTESLAGLRHAAELTGVSTQTMDMALQRFTRRASEAANGTGEAVGALRELGINAKDLQNVPLDEQMEIVADAMGTLDTQADRVRVAMKLFDSEGVALVNTLGGGSESLREMIQEADQLGISLSRVETAQIEMANDAFTRAKGVLTGLQNQLAVAFAPVLQTIADSFRQGALDSAEFGNIGQRVADAVVRAFANVQGAIHGVRKFTMQLRIGFIKLGKYIAEKLSPILGTFLTVYNKIAPLLGKPIIENPLVNFAQDAGESIQVLTAELEAMRQIDPAANILDAYEQIKLKSRETAEQIAADKQAQQDNEKNANQNTTKWEQYQNELKKKSAQNLANWEAKSASDKTKHFLGEASKQLANSKGQSKKLFALQKAASIATALINTYEGVSMALKSYPPPINFAFAAMNLASGMAQVSAIKSQSFDGGGFTGRGPRTGGIDGRGGFPAILHPNETVLDHTKGQGLPTSGGGSIVINQTINVSTGVQDTVRAEMQNMMPEIAEVTTQAVAAQRMRGGNYSKQLLGR